jgi:hypothetical protein
MASLFTEVNVVYVLKALKYRDGKAQGTKRKTLAISAVLKART